MALREHTASHEIWLAVTCGRFQTSDKEGNKKHYEEVEGDYVGHKVVFDEGSKENGIHPRDVLEIRLKDADEAYLVKCTFPSTFTWMFASHLPNIAFGERIQLRTWCGSDNEKVSLCMVDKLVEGQFMKIQRAEYPSDVLDKRHQAEQDIRNHPCYDNSVPPPSTNATTADMSDERRMDATMQQAVGDALNHLYELKCTFFGTGPAAEKAFGDWLKPWKATHDSLANMTAAELVPLRDRLQAEIDPFAE